MPTEPVRRQATELHRLWNELALQHVTLGGGACSCGIGGVIVRLQDFERDILDYLRGEAARQELTEVASVLEHRSSHDAQEGLAEVLASLSDPAFTMSDAAAEWLVGRLSRTLTSFSRLHGGAGRT